jgi:hypothetical protein
MESFLKLQPCPNNWSCLPTAFAIALDVNVSIVIGQIGHDGSRILWPRNPEPECRQGFHIQELIDVAWFYHNRAVTPIEALPCLHPRIEDPVHPLRVNLDRFEKYLKGNKGVLIGLHEGEKMHAVAWDGAKVYDPRGFVTRDLSIYTIQSFWMLTRVNY